MCIRDRKGGGRNGFSPLWKPKYATMMYGIYLAACALTAFDCVCGSGPAYFKDVYIPLADICSSRSNLRSAQREDLWACATGQNLARSPELSRCSSPVVWNVPVLSLPPLNIQTAIQSWIENTFLKLTTQLSRQKLRYHLRTFSF